MDGVRQLLNAALEAEDAETMRAQVVAVAQAYEDQALALAARLVGLNRLAQLGQNAAELVHELRQPLLGMKAWSQLLLERPADEKFVTKTAGSMLNQIGRLEQLAGRVLDLARGRCAESAASCDVNDAALAALELLASRLRKTHVTVTKELAAAIPAAPLGAAEMQQLFINLLANAADAVDDLGGRITIRTTCDADCVEAYVSDNGPGVPEAQRSRLFEPFATSKAEGTGIGLYLSRNLVTAAGGTLELVDSTAGATFRIRLPIIER